MKNNILNLFIAIFILFSSLVYSIDLQTAKNNGLVGEQSDGYLGIVIFSEDVKDLVDSINQKREIRYNEISKKNKQDIHLVERLAGAKLTRMVKKGQYFRKPDGKWMKK